MKGNFHVLLAAACASLTTFAKAAIYTETIDGIEWTYTVENGEASVGGGSSSSTAVPKNASGAITIPSTLGGCPVTRIQNSAFYDCNRLTSIMIPDSVIIIGEYAFFYCYGLTNVTIGSGTMSIGNYAFYYCPRLVNVTIPNSVVIIGNSAFEGCVGLTNVRIPNRVTNIGFDAFASCQGLVSVTIGNSVVNIGISAFKGCVSLASVSIPASVEYIGYGAFSKCENLVYVYFPEGKNISGQVSEVFPSSPTIVYYKPIQTVTFDVNGGTTHIDNIEVSYAFEYGSLPVPERIGYSFVGWEIGGKLVSENSIVNELGDHTLTAQWTPIKLIQTVGFDVNGGTTHFDNIEVSYASEYGPLPVPERIGYLFVGWGIGGELVSENSIVTEIADHTLTAQWTPIQYTVTFDANGGQGGIAGEVDYDSELEAPNVSREGYAFLGWTPEVAATVPLGGATYTAQWQINQYAVVFDANGGVGGTSTNLDYGTSIIVPTVTRTGYGFRGWSPSVDETVPAHDVTYTAQWTPIQYTVTFDANGGQGGISGEVDYDSELVAPEVSREGYTFLGWTPKVAAKVPLGGATYTAQWRINQYEVVFNTNGGDGGSSTNLNYWSEIVVPTVTRTGYSFRDWSPSVDETVPAHDVIYTAQWEINQYDVTFDANGGDGGTSGKQDYGTAIATPTVTRTGYTFKGWSPSVDETVPAHDVIYTAQWEVNQYTVTFDANGGEGGTSVVQNYCTPILVPTVIRTDYDFKGWSPAVDVTVPAYDVTYVAQWERKPFLYTVRDGCATIKECTSPVGDVVIPSVIDGYQVTAIGAAAFYGCANMTSVALPDSLISIGERAFWECSGLTSIIIPASVKTVGYCAFFDCVRLKDVHTPSLEAWCGISFACDYIRDIPFVDISSYSYYSNPLHYAKKLYVAGEVLTDLVIPNSVKKIGDGAFVGCNLKSVTLHDAVDSIGCYAFRRSGITNLVLKRVSSIGGQAFAYSSISNVSVGTCTASIADDAFYGCSRLLSFDVSENNTKYTSVNGLLLSKDGQSLYQGVNGDVSIPDEVLRVGACAFGGRRNLTNVAISGCVTNIAANAFDGCYGLTSAVIPDSVMNIGNNAFDGCNNLSNVVLGAGIKSIGEKVFRYCNRIIDITIPHSVTNIGYEAFDSCFRLECIRFKGDSPNIANNSYPFNGVCRDCCAYVRHESTGWDVNIPGKWQGIAIDWLDHFVTFNANGGEGGTTCLSDYGAEIDFPAVTRTGYTINGWMSSDGGYVVNAMVPDHDVTYTAQWTPNKYSVTFDANGGEGGTSAKQDYGSAIVAPTVTRTGYTLKGWSPSVAATVPANDVTYTAQWEINQYTVTFDANGGEGGMDQLFEYGSSLVMPIASRENYNLVGWFTEASGGSQVMEGTTVTGDMTLYAQWELKPNVWLYDVVDGNATITSYSSPSGDVVIPPEIDGYPVTAIAMEAFSLCSNMQSIVIPASVTRIAGNAFEGCIALRSIVFEGDAPEMGEDVFCGVPNDCRVYVHYGSSGWGVDIPGTWGITDDLTPDDVAAISGGKYYSFKVQGKIGEYVYVFTNTSYAVSFTPKVDVSIKEVFVLGGGGGGGPGGGGGGGGESLWITNAVDYAANESGISIYVGRGGSGGSARYSGDGVQPSYAGNGNSSWVWMKNPLDETVMDQYQGYGGYRGGCFYLDNASVSAGYGSYWGGSSGGGSALITEGHHAGDSVMNAAGRTYGRVDYGAGFGGAAVDGAPGGGGGGGLRGIASGGGNYADEGNRRSVVYAGANGADGVGDASGGRGGDGFPISVMGDSTIRVAIGNLVGNQDAWLGGGGGGGSGRNRSEYFTMWGIGAETPGAGGMGGGGSGGYYAEGSYADYMPGMGRDGVPFTGGGGGGGSFMEPVTNGNNVANNWILGGGKGADGFVVLLVHVKSGGGNGLLIDYLHHDVALDANGGTCEVGFVNVPEGPLAEELPVPVRNGVVFLGWFTEPEGGEKVDESTIVTGETTFYAHWLTEVAAPVVVPGDGAVFKTDSCEVTISCATEGAVVYYTDDGTTPKMTDEYLYTGPFTISDTTTVKALAVYGALKSGYAVATIAKHLLSIEEAVDCGESVLFASSDAYPWKPIPDVSAKVCDSSARSGEIGNRMNTWLSATVEGAGTMTFWCKTSCEHDEDNMFTWDRLMIYTNDVEIVEWHMDGETDWTERTLSFDGGVNTVKWVYCKDRTGADGEDCAWVDAVTWTPAGGSADVTIDVDGGKTVTVPGAWLSEKTERAATEVAANGRKVWECYVVGLDPEDTTNDFKIVSFPMGADGLPDVTKIAFDPPQAKWNVQGAVPVLKGKATLESGEWQTVTEENKAQMRFFKVEVEIP